MHLFNSTPGRKGLLATGLAGFLGALFHFAGDIIGTKLFRVAGLKLVHGLPTRAPIHLFEARVSDIKDIPEGFTGGLEVAGCG